MIHDPLVRKPFLSVFAWTFVFAAATVFFSFAAGLFLAITLDKRGLRFQKVYRSILIIPYAIPGFLSLLVWRGPPERQLRRRQHGSSGSTNARGSSAAT